MEMQAEAERRKLAQVLESEGQRQSINIADGKRTSILLPAKGEAEAMHVTADELKALSAAMKTDGGTEAASLRVAEQYIKAFGNITKEGTTVLIPSPTGNPSAMIAQALTIYKKLMDNNSDGAPRESTDAVVAGGSLEAPNEK